jgi:hypothetical protein
VIVAESKTFWPGDAHPAQPATRQAHTNVHCNFRAAIPAISFGQRPDIIMVIPFLLRLELVAGAI